jgi:hypothetical protein
MAWVKLGGTVCPDRSYLDRCGGVTKLEPQAVTGLEQQVAQ